MSTNARPKNDTYDAALRAVLAANPGATAAALAHDAGMSVSTARAILARMADDGTAVRATAPDTTRTTYRWALADTTGATAADTPTPPAPEDAEAAPADAATVKPAAPAAGRAGRKRKTGTPAPAKPGAAPTKGEADTAPADTAPAGDGAAGDGAATVDKLPSGGLRGMVEDYLRDNPGESFSPTALKHALEKIHPPRQLSSGAINNALEKLATDGVATRTSDAPKKWALAAGA